LARGVLRAFGVKGAVKSPTYTMVEPYATAHGPVAHFDFYRLASREEVEFLGMREYLDQGVCLFEWRERARGGLPAADIAFELIPVGTARELTAMAFGGPGEAWLRRLILRELLQESVPNT
ncbi:MAG TPA: tRNA (adenosine(37)-N6)-threonylcarbamoyltransferase complex ATPase subunit type 1 TsaE, partial [Alphaproteobacteria bacterium]|nr:tRNA (adenosine(37)-N6)-threonylcarbamoyltransferase complex ATPase subunit type 1 TsaE [Alphaproteobacteria bacterium]